MLQWLVEDYLYGPTGGGSALIDGFFCKYRPRQLPRINDIEHGAGLPLTNADHSCPESPHLRTTGDDQWEWDNSGPTEMDGNIVEDLGLNSSALLAHTTAYNWSQRVIFAETIRRGKWAWQMFALTARDGQYNPTDGPLVHKDSCAADLLHYCDAGSVAQTNAIIYAGSGNNEVDLANFLLVRGAYAWLGTGWIGCDNYPAPPTFPHDFGEPLGLCGQSVPGSGVFVREWSRATVSMNCSSWQPSIVMKPT